jgi:hypothetical protein
MIVQFGVRAKALVSHAALQRRLARRGATGAAEGEVGRG